MAPADHRSVSRATSRLSPVSSADAAARLLAEPSYGDDLGDYLAPLPRQWQVARDRDRARDRGGFRSQQVSAHPLVPGNGDHQADDAATNCRSSAGIAWRRQPRDARRPGRQPIQLRRGAGIHHDSHQLQFHHRDGRAASSRGGDFAAREIVALTSMRGNGRYIGSCSRA